MKPAALAIPPDSTARLLSSLRPPPPPPVEEDEDAPRKGEEEGMDVDSQAEASTDVREQDVPGVQLYDGSKSAVRRMSSNRRPILLKGPGLCVWLESNEREHIGNWVGPLPDIIYHRGTDLTLTQDKRCAGSRLGSTAWLRGRAYPTYIFVFPQRGPARHNLLGLESRWETSSHWRN